MKITETNIQLYGMESFVPQNKKDAYRVQKGSVFVYIIPWKDGEAGRKVFLCEIQENFRDVKRLVELKKLENRNSNLMQRIRNDLVRDKKLKESTND